VSAAGCQFVFGPVPSRRLGRSLGVDLVGPKTCCLDCIYCQVGRTTVHTLRRDEYVPADAVIAEVRAKLADDRPDYITMSGSGEPTLNSQIGRIIREIKSFTDVPIAVLTNGALLWDPEVRRDLDTADLVLPSLDATNDRQFQAVCRPCEGLSFERLIEGLVVFRREHAGPVWLEVFLVEGLNSSDADIEAFAELMARIRPDRIQLNAAVRPTAEADVPCVSRERMDQIARRLGPTAEVIADYPAPAAADARLAAREEQVLEMLQRRPCTVDDIAAGLGTVPNEVLKHVEHLLRTGRIRRVRRSDKDFYAT